MHKTTLAVGAALSLLFIASACSHSRTIKTQDGSVTVEQGKNGANSSLHAEGKDGTSLDINTGKAITDYPTDVPLYSGKSTMDMKSGEKHARTVILQTPDSIGKISDFYKSELESKGWKVETTLTTERMAMYKASKDNREMVVQIGTDNGQQSTISQTIADK